MVKLTMIKQKTGIFQTVANPKQERHMKELPFKNYSNYPNFFGYPLFYVVDGKCVCGDCCNESWEAGEEYFMPIDHPATNNTVYNEEISEHVNYDDNHLYCANCSKKIEGAYLETGAEEEQ